MFDVSWLGEAMEKAGFSTQTSLAEEAGVSTATVGNALRKGRVRESTAEKLQAACGEFPIGPYADTSNIIGKVDDKLCVAFPIEQDLEDCVKRLEGSDCPTAPAVCAGCFDLLKTTLDPKDLPQNRACCRLQHSWVFVGGILHYVSADGSKIPAEEI